MADNVTIFPGSPAPSNVLPIISAGDWRDKPVPDRMWLMADWIPLQRATLLTGDGGSGKSLLAQQLATCAAIGLPFMGVPVRQSDALYITCEDDRGELHRRQAAICRSLGIGLGDLDRHMFLLSRCGELENSLVHYANDGLMLSRFYQQIEETVKASGTISFLILDNIAHLFEGNENVRQHVAIFCNALEALCRSVGSLTILFIGHPSKAGAQFSGSTAWENQVRSRIYLERPKDDAGSQDDDVRVLSRAKANYSKAGDSISMRWSDWAFVEHDAQSDDWQSGMTESAAAAGENEHFLKMLARCDEQGRTVSARPRAANFAPRQFAKMPGARGMKLEQFDRAMERLLERKLIREEVYTSGADRHSYRRLIATAGQSAGQSMTTPQVSRSSAAEARKSDKNAQLASNAGQSRGPDAGQSMTTPHNVTQHGENPRELDAGQSRASSGAVGAGGKPPIGGLSHRPPPAAIEGWEWLDPRDGLPPIEGGSDED